jgi:fumarylacetoacetase
MRDAGTPPARVTHSEFSNLYWSFAQMVAHHTSNGCNLKSGDLIGSGTVSGPDPETGGCLLELSENGASPLALPGDERRSYLEDGDELVIEGTAETPGFRSIGFGGCAGRVLPASRYPSS